MGKSTIERNMPINQMADIHHKWVTDRAMDMALPNKTPLECMALIAAEVGEILNMCVGNKPTHLLGDKLAYIMLGVLDLAKQQRIDIGHEITSRMLSNTANGNLKNRSQ